MAQGRGEWCTNQDVTNLLAEEERCVPKQAIQNNVCWPHPRYLPSSHGSNSRPPGLPRISRREGPRQQTHNTACHCWRHTWHTIQVSASPLRGFSGPFALQGYGSLPHDKQSFVTKVTHFHPHQFLSPASVRLRPQSSPAQTTLTYQVSAPHGGGDVSSLRGPGRFR